MLFKKCNLRIGATCIIISLLCLLSKYNHPFKTTLPISNINLDTRMFPIDKIMFNRDYQPPKLCLQTNPFCNGKYWAVTMLTTALPLSEAVRRLKYTKFCVVIVGDKDLPNDIYKIRSTLGQNIILLDEEEQNKIESEYVDGLKWNHFGRKNVGYLYAIANGAEVIWDFNADNMFKFWLEGATNTRELDFSTYFPGSYEEEALLVYESTMRQSLDYHSSEMINPYPILGCDQEPCWPRGFPLTPTQLNSTINTLPASLNLTSVKWSNIGILQSLADYHPDVDAIFRANISIPTLFNLSKSPYETMANDPHPLLVRKGVFAPLNDQAALFYQPAFFALYLPITVEETISDIWRGYIAEAVLNLYNIQVGFLPKPLVINESTRHQETDNLLTETLMRLQSEELISFLSDWMKDTKEKVEYTSFVPILEYLWVKLYEKDFIELEDVFSLQRWIKTLQQIGFKFPGMAQSKINANNTVCQSNGPFFNVGKSVLETKIPLPLSCQDLPRKQFWTSELHTGTRIDQASVLANLNQTVIISGAQAKDRDQYKYNVATMPNINIYSNLSPTMKKCNTYHCQLDNDQIESNLKFYATDPVFQKTDAFMCLFPPSICQLYIPTGKSIVFIAAHRYNINRCTLDSWTHLTQQLINLSKDPRHTVAGLSRYDMEYIKYYTGIQNVQIVESFSGIYTADNIYNPTKPEILAMWRIQQYEEKEQIPFESIVQKVKQFTIVDSYKKYPRPFKQSDILSHRAMIYFVYSTMSYKLTEFYSMGLPMFVPSPRFFALAKNGFGMDRAITSAFYCGPNSDLQHKMPQAKENSHPYNPNILHGEDVDSEQYWLQFADFYSWPHITYFDNASDLETKLAEANFTQIHIDMMRENELRKFTLQEGWCDIIREI